MQKLHLNKRIKTCENYGETIMAMSQNVTTFSTTKLPNCQYKLKIEASVANATTYYIFHQLNAICRYC